MGIIAVMFKIFNSCFLGCLFFIVRAKKQHWAASLCHSLIPHTYEELLLRFVTGYPPSPAGGVLLLAHSARRSLYSSGGIKPLAC